MRFALSVLGIGLLMLGSSASSASAERALISERAVTLEQLPEKRLEDPCGVLRSPGGGWYVSDYYRHTVYSLSTNGALLGSFPRGQLNGPCGLAAYSTNVLYANDWHAGVVRLLPSLKVFDTNESTGVAVDDTGNVYVNDRTYVAVYEASGEPVLDAGAPLRIGLGSLGDAYGLAVFGGRAYVPDAADQTVKVFESAGDPAVPVATISGFNSLTDAAAAIDPTNGHLLVVDNLQPGFLHPKAAIKEYDGAGEFLGSLGATVIDGGPSGISVDGSGFLYVTSGNSDEGTIFTFGQYEPGASPGTSAPPGVSASSPPLGGASPQAPGVSARTGRFPAPTAGASEVVQKGPVRVHFEGKLSPHRLPRRGSAPVRVSVGARIDPTKAGTAPQLRAITIAINRNGHFETRGLPLCRLDQIQPATTAAALAACRPSLVGEGEFSANVVLTHQAPFPSRGKVFAFNGTWHGHPAILAHVYGTDPVPTSFTLPFVLSPSRGTFGTVLRAALPEVTGSSGYITGLQMTLGRRFSSHGRPHSYISAGCPAPKGFSAASFPLARANFIFAKTKNVNSTLVRSCGVRR